MTAGRHRLVEARFGHAAGTRLDARLRVATWNIEFGRDVDGAIRLLTGDPMLDSADVLLLQEMDADGVARIAEALAMNSVYVAGSVHPRSGREFGNAILSAAPLTNPRAVPLPHQASVQGQPRVALAADVATATGSIACWSIHTEIPSMRWERRLAQFSTIADAAADGTRRSIVGGDFNTATERGIRAVTRLLGDAGHARTTGGTGPTKRRATRRFTLDHIYARGLDVVDSGRVDGAPASDHDALWADLGLPPSAFE